MINSVRQILTYSGLLLTFILIFAIPSAHADEWVNGYFRSNGTYVNGYYRSDPDGNPYNNYSFPGNYNPYTGVTASGNPDTYLNDYYSQDSYDDSSTYGDYYEPSYDSSYTDYTPTYDDSWSNWNYSSPSYDSWTNDWTDSSYDDSSYSYDSGDSGW